MTREDERVEQLRLRLRRDGSLQRVAAVGRHQLLKLAALVAVKHLRTNRLSLCYDRADSVDCGDCCMKRKVLPAELCEHVRSSVT